MSWNDCQGFLHTLDAKLGKTLTLPSEAQWEYACRAGAATEFYFGDSKDALGDHAWWSPNSEGTTQPVGLRKPNAWGLHDMAGNVFEWCEDWSGPYDKEAQKGPQGPPSGAARILRGGSWRYDPPVRYRCANRHDTEASYRFQAYGFRVSRTIDVAR